MRVEPLAVVARQGLAVERVLEGRRRHEVGRERLAVEVVLVYFERLDLELVDWFQRYGINNAVGQLLPVRHRVTAACGPLGLPGPNAALLVVC